MSASEKAEQAICHSHEHPQGCGCHDGPDAPPPPAGQQGALPDANKMAAACLELALQELPKAQDGLEKYFEAYGAEHLEDCPEDDTCDCPLVLGINGAENRIRIVLQAIEAWSRVAPPAAAPAASEGELLRRSPFTDMNDARRFKAWFEQPDQIVSEWDKDRYAMASAILSLSAAEQSAASMRERLLRLALQWRKDDFAGHNFATKRDAAAELQAALQPEQPNDQ